MTAGQFEGPGQPITAIPGKCKTPALASAWRAGSTLPLTAVSTEGQQHSRTGKAIPPAREQEDRPDRGTESPAPDGWSGSAGASRGTSSARRKRLRMNQGDKSRTRSSVEHALEEECLWRGRHTDSRSVGAVRRPGIDREAPTRGSRRHHRPHTADGDMEGGDDTMTRLEHGLCEPHSRRSGVARSKAELSLRPGTSEEWTVKTRSSISGGSRVRPAPATGRPRRESPGSAPAIPSLSG
jgi:hypothetical protein